MWGASIVKSSHWHASMSQLAVVHACTSLVSETLSEMLTRCGHDFKVYPVLDTLARTLTSSLDPVIHTTKVVKDSWNPFVLPW